MFARRALPSEPSLLDRHHRQDRAQISVRVGWHCTNMHTCRLATARCSHLRHASHPLRLSRAFSQANLLFGRRRLGTHERGLRDRDLVSSKVGKTQLRRPCSHGEYEPRDAKDEVQFMGTMRCRVPFGHATVLADAVVIERETSRFVAITLWLS
jgi:hypothetical protein